MIILIMTHVSVEKTIKTVNKIFECTISRMSHQNKSFIIIIYCIHMYKTKLISTISIFLSVFIKMQGKDF